MGNNWKEKEENQPKISRSKSMSTEEEQSGVSSEKDSISGYYSNGLVNDTESVYSVKACIHFPPVLKSWRNVNLLCLKCLIEQQQII